MDRRSYLRIAGAAATAAAAGCLDGRARAGADHDVGMTTREFTPADVTIAPGETVVWRNTSSHAHTVTAYEADLPADAAYFASGGFPTQRAAENGWADRAGGALYRGDTYAHEFTVPGIYPYYCIPHEQVGMVGTVVVEE